ncbi:hypothetical protein F3J27_00100 [Enterobacter sp. Ap-916]|nr:hypothetical protein [Enterobacter sp. Cy-643]NIF58175.1 hypothetical protein [Enterobacter sp. Ap-867]NIG27883.1 hypothetical protein [Enterobacter sp. Ap-916]
MLKKRDFIRAWYSGATIFTCFTLGNEIGNRFFYGSKIPWLISIIIAFVICGSARSYFSSKN